LLASVVAVDVLAAVKSVAVAAELTDDFVDVGDGAWFLVVGNIGKNGRGRRVGAVVLDTPLV